MSCAQARAEACITRVKDISEQSVCSRCRGNKSSYWLKTFDQFFCVHRFIIHRGHRGHWTSSSTTTATSFETSTNTTSNEICNTFESSSKVTHIILCAADHWRDTIFGAVENVHCTAHPKLSSTKTKTK